MSNITGENNSAFNLWYASEHVITGNYVEGIPYNAFNLNATSGSVVFTNNTIKDIGQSGFQIANSAAGDVNVEIKDNSFEEIGNSAIRLYGDMRLTWKLPAILWRAIALQSILLTQKM